MPSESEVKEIWPGCCTCSKRFKAGDPIYMEHEDNRPTTWCEDCFTKALMLRLDDIAGDAWTQPFMELYRLLFPGEKTSKFAKPLIRAMQAFYVKNWNQVMS